MLHKYVFVFLIVINVIFWIHCMCYFANIVITPAFKEILLIRISIVCNRKIITKLSSVMLIRLL